MRAVVIPAHGDPSVLEVRAAGVNFADTLARVGALAAPCYAPRFVMAFCLLDLRLLLLPLAGE
jgi:hypothetical protein